MTFLKLFSGVSFKTVKRYNSLKLSIPKVRPDCLNTLLLVWPKLENANNSINCYCHPFQHAYSFEDCVHDCGSDFKIEVETVYQNFIFFRNISRGNFLIHFICENYFCNEPDCRQENYLISYFISIGKIIKPVMY